MPFNQGMTIPHELALVRTAAGLRLAHRPLLPEGLPAVEVTDASPRELEPPAEAYRCDIRLADSGALDLQIGGICIKYLEEKKLLLIGGDEVPWPLEGEGINLTLVVDRLVVECFSDDGLLFAIARTGETTP